MINGSRYNVRRSLCKLHVINQTLFYSNIETLSFGDGVMSFKQSSQLGLSIVPVNRLLQYLLESQALVYTLKCTATKWQS